MYLVNTNLIALLTALLIEGVPITAAQGDAIVASNKSATYLSASLGFDYDCTTSPGPLASRDHCAQAIELLKLDSIKGAPPVTYSSTAQDPLHRVPLSTTYISRSAIVLLGRGAKMAVAQ